MRPTKHNLIILIIFFLITIVLGSLILYPNFPDPDSFYHAKMATIIRDQGFIANFPWLTETIFNEQYINHHLLYHLILIPFVTIFNPLIGTKVAALFFGLSAFIVLFLILRNLRVPYPEWLTLGTALSANFLHRMRMPRAISLSLIIVLISLWAMLRKKYWLIFLMAFTFVWFYNGWPLLITALACVFFGQIFSNRFYFTEKKLWQIFKETIKEEKDTILTLISGLLFGFLTHPYFPANLNFGFLHILKIGFLNATNNISVGSEWYPADPVSFVVGDLPAIFILVLGTTLFLPGAIEKQHKFDLKDKQEAWEIFSLFFFAAGATIMTLKSSRYFEYAIPCLVLVGGVLLRFSWPFIEKEIKPTLINVWKKRWFKITTFIIIPTTLFCLTFNTLKGLQPTNDYYQGAQFIDITTWIKDNVPAGEIIFHNVWDFSMVMWYLDDSHRYLVGLDPMFMYEKNPEKFNLLTDLVSGKEEDVSLITSSFNSRVVVVDLRFPDSLDFIKNLNHSGLFQETVSNQWLRVFVTQDLYESSRGYSHSQ